jgi:hypothetical protein
MLATAEGTSRVPDEELNTIVRELLTERESQPGA